jgi:adenylate kinase family enzyme
VQRILVIGSPGAGKSTFARALAMRTGLPLIHLDAEYWRSGWVEPPAHEWLARLEALTASERWIMDGNYGGSLAMRLARADAAIWLDYPTGLCLWRVLCRTARYRGVSRPDMAPGCPEQVNLEFLRYIATFRRTKRPGIVRRLERFEGKVVRFATPAAAGRWLAELHP